MSSTFANGPEFNTPVSRPTSRPGLTIIELLVTVAIIAILIALLLPASRSSGEASRRAQCVNNLKQIALALRNYEMEYGALPPAHTVDAKGRPLHSWRTLILPYLEQETLYRTIDLSKPWNDPANAAARETHLSAFHCPSSKAAQNTTNYLAIVGSDCCWNPTSPRRLAEITDAHELTLMVIEADDEKAVPWMAPLDADESYVMSLGPTTKLHHSGGTNAGFVDGRVIFLKATVPLSVRRAMMTIDGGEAISNDSW